MTPIIQIVILGVGTLTMRSLAITVLAGRRIPEPVGKALRLVAPAMLSGLVVQTLLFTDGSVRGFDSWHIAALGAALVAWRTRSIAITLGAGMAMLWLLQLLV